MDLAVESLLAWKGVAVLVWFGAFFAAERLLPAAPRPAPLDEPGRGCGGLRLARNLGLWLVNAAISPLIVVPVSLLASEIALAWRPEAWQGWPALLVDIVVLDFLIYWWHLANHRVPLLWRFHEVHHLDRFLDATTAIRFHFGEVLLSAAARAAVIFLLGFPILSILVFETLLLMAAVFHHSNLRLPAALERPLALVIITPSIHWVHHHARQTDTDSNYGTIFSFWDRLFATRNRMARRLDMTIGVEGRDEQPFVRLFARPFLPTRLREAAEP